MISSIPKKTNLLSNIWFHVFLSNTNIYTQFYTSINNFYQIIIICLSDVISHKKTTTTTTTTTNTNNNNDDGDNNNNDNPYSNWQR